MKKLLFSSFIMLCLGVTGWGQIQFFSSGNSNINATSSWWTNADGTGINPTNFTTASQVFNVQNGHQMTASAALTVSGTESKVVIKTGGKISSGTYNHTLTLDMESGGYWKNENTSYSNLSFGIINLNSTFELAGSGSAWSRTYPNLIISTTTAQNPGTTSANIQGTLTLKTGSTFRGTTTGSPIHTIGGDLIIESGGTWVTSYGSGMPTYNINGTITNNGSISSPIANGLSVINMNGSNSIDVTWGTKTGNKHSISIVPFKSVTFSDILVIDNGTLIVDGSLILGINVLSGTGGFTLSSGATLTTAKFSGIDGSIAVSGTKTFDVAANYTFNGSSAQLTGTFLPATINNLTIDNAAGVTLSNSALMVNGTMTINSGKLFTLETGKQLTVGALTNNADAGLLLQSPANSGAPGSLIVSGSISGSGTLKLERYVAAYSGATDGWHILSSPVNNFAIAGSTFEPGSAEPNIDDLYWYEELNNTWKNYKVGGNFSSFTNGYGYLCSYQTAAAKHFTGTPNNSDITFSDLTLTSTRGWHAIGNPFQSALKWNDGNWTLSNVNTTAKLLNSGGTYSNLVANDIIPAMQGVFVQVTDATNTITIPKAARTHNTASWNKSGNEILVRLRFTAASETDNTYIETDFLFDSQASTSVDEQNDGFFLQGIETAPQMFLKIDNQDLSLKRMPTLNGVYNLHFIKGLGSDYSFTMSGIESLPENILVTLTDTKTNQSQVLTEIPVYSFTSEASDSPDRFLLVFGVVGIGENNPDQTLQAYVSGNHLYVLNTLCKANMQLFDLQGRLIQSSQLNGEGLQSQPLNQPAGVYIVRVQNEKAVKSARVVISE